MAIAELKIDQSKDLAVKIIHQLALFIQNDEFEHAAEHFHYPCVVMHNESHNLIKNSRDMVAWISEFKSYFIQQFGQQLRLRISRSKQLSEKLKFTLVTFTKVDAKSQTSDGLPTMSFTVSIENDDPKVVVLVIDEH